MSLPSLLKIKSKHLSIEWRATTRPVDREDYCDSSFVEFRLVTADEVLEVIKSAPVTCCMLDPLPISAFTNCIEDLLPVITKIVNCSLSKGTFPSRLKEACVHPLLKKQHLDSEDLSNYRPISNLRYVSKIIERVVVSQLNDYE